MNKSRKWCALCGHEMKPLFTATDRNMKISHCEYFYECCPACGYISLHNVPTDLSRHYAGIGYHTPPSREHLEHIAAREAFKLDTLLRFMKGGQLLEIGSSYGAFAHLARRAGFNVTAVEMDGGCCKYMRTELGLKVVETDNPVHAAEDIGIQDVIAMWQSLEHLPAPGEMLRAAASAIAPGGILIVSTPNPDSIQFQMLGRLWPHLDAPRHTCLIPLSTLTCFLEEHGLSRIYQTATDQGGRSCNRFGWGAWLSQPIATPVLKRAAYLAGCGFSLLAAPLEMTGFRGSTYTSVFRKAVSP